jgi:phosphoribosylformylglycinamidine cyclo-ligase
VPEIFRIIGKKGNVPERDMYRTLNMGIGMVLVVAKGDADRARRILAENGVGSHVIGRVAKGKREVVIKG